MALPGLQTDGTTLVIGAGAECAFAVQWTDDTGAPVDLTGATARWQYRAYLESPTVLVELTTSAGIAVDLTTATLAITLTAAQTTALAHPARGVWGVSVTLPASDPVLIAEGRVVVQAANPR